MSSSDGLPESWGWAPLGELAEINPRIDKTQFSDSLEVSFVPMPAVEPESGKIDVSAVRRFGKVKKGYTPFREGDVLFAKITPCMENGKTCVVPEVLGGIAFGSTEFHVIRPPSSITPQWVSFYLVQQSFRHEARRNMTGSAGQLRVRTQYLASSQIPVAPTSEQERIVEAIEAQFTRLDAGVGALGRVEANLKRYKAAVLKAACEGRLLPPGYDSSSFSKPAWKEIDNAIASLEQGWSPKCERFPSDDAKIWGVIKTSAVQRLSFVESENKRLPDSLSPRPQLALQANDLLMTRAGPRSRCGVCCLVRSTRPRLLVCDKVYRIRCIPEVANPGYLEIALNAPPVLDALNTLKTGISDSGVNLTQKRFRQLRIPIPALEIQTFIESEVRRLVSLVDDAEVLLDRSMRRCGRLRQSILKRAFEGKLVPQDPADEPASVLLKRIRGERERVEASGGKKKRRRAGTRVAAGKK